MPRSQGLHGELSGKRQFFLHFVPTAIDREAMGRAAGSGTIAGMDSRWRCAMTQVDDLSRSLVPFEQDRTLVAVLEMSQSSWLAAAVVPGISQRPLKKLEPDPVALVGWLGKWREKAGAAGRCVDRVVLVFEAGRDGFWLARWLRAQGVEAFVVHSTSVAVSREHRRAKTDRLDTEMLIRVFLGWLRGEPR